MPNLSQSSILLAVSVCTLITGIGIGFLSAAWVQIRKDKRELKKEIEDCINVPEEVERKLEVLHFEVYKSQHN